QEANHEVAVETGSLKGRDKRRLILKERQSQRQRIQLSLRRRRQESRQGTNVGSDRTSVQAILRQQVYAASADVAQLHRPVLLELTLNAERPRQRVRHFLIRDVSGGALTRGYRIVAERSRQVRDTT